MLIDVSSFGFGNLWYLLSWYVSSTRRAPASPVIRARTLAQNAHLGVVQVPLGTSNLGARGQPRGVFDTEPFQSLRLGSHLRWFYI